MPKPPSPYDILQVPRGATSEAIRAAYKTLARRYHPDHNGNSEQSHQLMQTLNGAFEVLNDPARRAAHDEWLLAQERYSLERWTWLTSAWGEIGRRDTAPPIPLESAKRRFARLGAAWLPPVALVLIASWVVSGGQDGATSPTPPPPPLAPLAYLRPSTAPNGSPWPTTAGEVAGYPVRRADGQSVVILDNTRNATEAFAILFHLEHGTAIPVRHIYLPAAGRYHCKHVRKGEYHVVHQDLSSGTQRRSAPFSVRESRTALATNHTVMTITLLPPTDGIPVAK